MSFNIIIPSANPYNLIPCVNSIFKNDSGIAPHQIIVIDDGAREGAESHLPKIQWIAGIKPFIYSRNCNLGINKSESHVILLNDDTILKSKDGFSNLVRESEAYGGIVSSATNSAGNPKQYPRGQQDIRPEPSVLAFISVCIPRNVLDAVGALDERFTAYGWEDNDYCRRAIDKGFKLGVFDGCFVDHTSLTSTFRGKNGPGNIEPGRKIYKEKWGC